MNVAPADTAAQRVFADGLRTSPVSLRSRMVRDDIDDVEIVAPDDLDVAATRQIMKVASVTAARVDITAEVDALDVLEAVDIVAAPAPASAPRTSAPSRDIPTPPPQPWLSAAYTAHDDEAYDDDAYYYARPEPCSTSALTYNLSDEREPELGPYEAQEAFEPLVTRRSLRPIVGTILAAAAALVISALVAEHFPAGTASAPSPVVAAPAPAPPAHAPSTPTAKAAEAAPAPAVVQAGAVPSIDVKSLPAALVGSIVAPHGYVLVVDGVRAAGSTAVVACGKHVVKVGASRKLRSVDVPCGAALAVR